MLSGIHILVIAFVGLISVIGAELIFRGKKVRNSQCGRCGYDVRDAATFVCSECGGDLRLIGILPIGYRRLSANRRLVAIPAVTFAIFIVWFIAGSLLADVFARGSQVVKTANLGTVIGSITAGSITATGSDPLQTKADSATAIFTQSDGTTTITLDYLRGNTWRVLGRTSDKPLQSLDAPTLQAVLNITNPSKEVKQDLETLAIYLKDPGVVGSGGILFNSSGYSLTTSPNRWVMPVSAIIAGLLWAGITWRLAIVWARERRAKKIDAQSIARVAREG